MKKLHYRWIYGYVTTCLVSVLLMSCSKEWLEIKSDKKLVVPSNLNDAAAILENTVRMNEGMTPNLFDISCDDYAVADGILAAVTPWERNAYLWERTIFVDNKGAENWTYLYQQIYNANLALDVLNKLPIEKPTEIYHNEITGRALFFRAWGNYQLVNLFSPVYDPSTAENEKGIVLRTSIDLNKKTQRSSLQETYDAILNDLSAASTKLPDKPSFKTHPSKGAAYALKAKTYLMMGYYEDALAYADSSLAINNTLIDYNTINTSLALPFTRFNEEVVFHSTVNIASIIQGSNINISPNLYNMYEDSDIRKRAFFQLRNGNLNFKGTYNNSIVAFGGIGTSELYLIKAECLIRENRLTEAKEVLNALFKHRYDIDKSVNYTNQRDFLDCLLQERRKELVMRGIRWTDLKRLNRSKETETVLMREVGGESYVLNPNDPLYVLPIPDIVIETSGIEQNKR